MAAANFPLTTNNKTIILLGAFFGFALATPALFSNFFDDAYIHARIAENTIVYGTPTFNNGEIFKAGSSTGFVLLIAWLSKVFGILGAIRAIEFFSIFVTIASIFYLACSSGQQKTKALLVVLCITPFFLLAAYGGMETPIVCMLIAGAAIAHFHGKHWLTIFLISTCTWFRFETILLLALISVYYIHSERNRFAIFFAVPFVVLIATELIIFGDIIPHAARVKPIAFGFPLVDSAYNALSFDYGKKGLLFGLLLLITLSLKTIWPIRNKLKFELYDALYVFSAGILFAWIIGKTLIFPWYYTLLTFPFGIALILGSQDNPGNARPARRPMHHLELVAILGFGLLGLRAILPTYVHADSINLRVLRYVEIGSGLYSFCPSCKLVTSEIGGLGYSFKGWVGDAFGLGDPKAASFHPMKVPEERQGHYLAAIPPAYVKYRNADFVVSMPIFSMALRASGVLDRYARYDCPLDKNGGLVIWGDTTIQVFSKKPLPRQTALAMGCEKI